MRHLIRIAVLVVGLSVVLGGCSPAQPPVRIGVLVWPPYELAYLARTHELYPADTLQLVDYHTPAEMVRAYRHDLIQGIFVTNQFILDRNLLPDSARIVYVIDASEGGDSLIVKPDIQELADLEGKRLGVEAGPLGGYMLLRLLDFANLQRSDVELVYLDTPDQAGAFEIGEVDAVITYEPTRTRLLNNGARELFSSRQISDEILDVLVVSTATLNEHADTLRDFIHGLSAARDLLERADDNLLQPLADREGISVADFRQAMRGVHVFGLEENRALFSGSPSKLTTLLLQQTQSMFDAKLITDPIDPVQVVDASLINASESR